MQKKRPCFEARSNQKLLLLDNHFRDCRDDYADHDPGIGKGSFEPAGRLDLVRVERNPLRIALGGLDGLVEGILEVDDRQVKLAFALLCRVYHL